MCLLLLAGPPVAAEVEVGPFIGLRSGGEATVGGGVLNQAPDFDFDDSASYGLVADYRLGADTWLTFLWSHQETEFGTSGLLPGAFGIDVDYLHAGGVYRPHRDGKTSPFVMVSAGVTLFSAEPSGFGSEAGVSMAAGGGAKIRIGDRVGLRLEARGYATFHDAIFDGICGGTGCSFALSSDGLFQVEGLMGLAIAF